ncbi:MAG: molybdopterin-binding protein [Methylococcales bacterium]
MSEQLAQDGFQVTRHAAVGDPLDSLIELLREISSRADCCICTGGLGPTGDDLTAEAVGLAFDRSLITDLDAVVQIEAHFIRMGRHMPQVNLNRRQLRLGLRQTKSRH